MRTGLEDARGRLQSLEQLDETGRAGVVNGANLRIRTNEQQGSTSGKHYESSHHRRLAVYFGNAPRGTSGISLSAFS